MTIHTFEVSSQLTNEKFYSIQNELKQKDKSKWEAEKNGMTYFGLSARGILIKFYIVRKKKYTSYFVTYRISARRVIENGNFVGLFDTKNYDALEDMVNMLIKSKSEQLPKLKKCNLRRMDFCVNARLENQEQVKAYIKIMKRANVPSKLELYEEYDKVSKRQKPMKDDFTVWASEYVAVSVYNKYAEMKKQKKSVFPESEINRVDNIVRIEIRCMEGKIRALKKKFGIETIREFMRNAEEIGDYLYKYYLQKMLGTGSIYSLKKALERIDMSGYKQSNVEILKEFVITANQQRSAADAVKIFKQTDGKKEVKRIISMMNLIETNYVTAPNDTVKLFKHGYIPTPMELYERERRK